MHTFAGILLLLIGLAFPMGMLFWLNGRLSRKPAPKPREIGLLLAFNGVLPVSLILAGLGLLSAAIWTSAAVRTALIASAAAAGILFLVLLATGAWRRPGGNDGG